MKKHLMNFTSLRRGAGKWILAALISAATVTTEARAGLSEDPQAKNVSIKYLGGEDGQQSFVVNYENEEGNRFYLTITDAAGYKLYQAAYTDKSFNKVFTVPGLEDGKLIFIFKDGKTNSSQTYEVNTTVKRYQEVKVKRIR